MDAKSVEQIARVLGRSLPRRKAVALILTVVTGGSIAGAGAVDAAPRRMTCRANGASCTRNANCCSGACATGRTEPRRRRNRCVCARQCDGRVCGDDGCGGMCGTCEGGLMCAEDGGACESPCLNYNPAGPEDYCIGTTSGERVAGYGLYGWYQPWVQPADPSVACGTDDECQLGAICDAEGFRCLCALSHRFDANSEPVMFPSGTCVAARVSAPTCTSSGISPYSKCGTTINGEELGFTENLYYTYDFYDDACTSDATCWGPVCDEPGRRCYCEISSWYGRDSSGYGMNSTGASCQMVSLS